MPKRPHKPSPDSAGFRTFTLSFKATNLPSMDFISPSDGYVILYERSTLNVDQNLYKTSPADKCWVRIGHSEVIMDDPNPKWEQTLQIEVNSIGLSHGEFRIEVWDADSPDLMSLKDQDIIGETQFKFSDFGHEIVGTQHFPLERDGKAVIAKNCPPARLSITIDEYSLHQRKALVQMETSINGKQRDDIITQFVQIKKDQNLETNLVVYQSPISNGIYPIFDINEDRLYSIDSGSGGNGNDDAHVDQIDETIHLNMVSNNPAFTIISTTDNDIGGTGSGSGSKNIDDNNEFEIRLVKFKDTMSTKILASTRLPALPKTLSTENILGVPIPIKLFNPDVKKKNEQTGSILIKQWKSVPATPSYDDFLNCGLNYNISFAIDCSGSSGDKKSDSLHNLNSQGQNQFTQAINDIGNCIINGIGVKNINKINSYGFGGPISNDPYAINQREKYALGMRDNINVNNPNDIVQQYITFTKIPFPNASPNKTNFGPFLSFFNQDKVIINNNNITNIHTDGCINIVKPEYNVLLIFTDGEINDIKDTLQHIYDLAGKPVSIIFIGLSNNPNNSNNTQFKDLEQFNTQIRCDGLLKVDKGLILSRHMTHFVPYSNFNNNLEYLKIKLSRLIQSQVVTQHFLASKVPVKE